MPQFSNSEEEVRRALWRIIGKVLKLGHLLNENMFRIFFCTRFYNNDTQKQMIYVMHLSLCFIMYSSLLDVPTTYFFFKNSKYITCLQLYLGICWHCCLGTLLHCLIGACRHYN